NALHHSADFRRLGAHRLARYLVQVEQLAYFGIKVRTHDVLCAAPDGFIGCSTRHDSPGADANILTPGKTFYQFACPGRRIGDFDISDAALYDAVDHPHRVVEFLAPDDGDQVVFTDFVQNAEFLHSLHSQVDIFLPACYVK